MKKILLLFIIGFLFMACADEKSSCCVNIDTGISIKYVNEKGENLLDIDGGIKTSDIKLYHKIDGKWVYYFEGNLDVPNGLIDSEREDGSYLMIFPSMNIIENNYSETKIEFSPTDFDVIKTEVKFSNVNTIVTKVWYNDELKWEAYATERMFEIIK